MPQKIDLAFDLWRRSCDDTKMQWLTDDLDQARRQRPHEITCRDHRGGSDEARDDHSDFTPDVHPQIRTGQIAVCVTRSDLHIDVSEIRELRFRDGVAGQSKTSTGDEDTFFLV